MTKGSSGEMSDVGTPFETMQEEGEGEREDEGIAEPTTEHRPRARQAHYTLPAEEGEDNCDRFSHSQNKFWEENKMKERERGGREEVEREIERERDRERK